MVVGVFLVGQFARRQCAVAQAGRRKRRPASGLADVRAARLRLSVRLRRACWSRCRSPRRSACWCALRFANISRARSTPARAALSHGEPGHRTQRSARADVSLRSRSTTPRVFAREDFLAGPSNAAALALIERWPDWPARTVLLRRAGRLRQKPSRGDLGARMPARGCCRRARSTSAERAGRARHRRAGGRRSRRRRLRRSARCFICSISRARSAPIVLITARTAPATLADRDAAISPRGCARCRWWR